MERNKFRLRIADRAFCGERTENVTRLVTFLEALADGACDELAHA